MFRCSEGKTEIFSLETLERARGMVTLATSPWIRQICYSYHFDKDNFECAA
jgi:hypothetical protein